MEGVATGHTSFRRGSLRRATSHVHTRDENDEFLLQERRNWGSSSNDSLRLEGDGSVETKKFQTGFTSVALRPEAINFNA